MSTRYFALIIGIVYLLVGIMGFIPGAGTALIAAFFGWGAPGERRVAGAPVR
jgi:hypothetical protein